MIYDEAFLLQEKERLLKKYTCNTIEEVIQILEEKTAYPQKFSLKSPLR